MRQQSRPQLPKLGGALLLLLMPSLQQAGEADFMSRVRVFERARSVWEDDSYLAEMLGLLGWNLGYLFEETNLTPRFRIPGTAETRPTTADQKQRRVSTAHATAVPSA